VDPRPRPYRVRELRIGVASWRIVTVTTHTTAIGAQNFARWRRLTRGRLFIDRRDAPGSLDQIAYVDRTEQPF
jgi:hypothetical protein